jgi:quercetin dioxygenase-like cupin family protein
MKAMKSRFTMPLMIALGGACPAERDAHSPDSAEDLVVSLGGSRSSSKGPPDKFVGTVTITPLFEATPHTRAGGASVTFEPGARSAWHTHPAGQVLIILSGIGWVQQWGGKKHEVKAGDVIWTPPGVKHWHGGTPTTAMTHIAIQEHVDGKVIDWAEPVTDEQYAR